MTDPKFTIEIDEETTLRRDDMVEHVEHGPMYVDSIVVGPSTKTAELKSELGPLGLDLTAEELREQWGETVHADPFELGEPGSARFESSGISVDGSAIKVSITTHGAPQKDAECVHMHAKNQIVRGLQAVAEGQPPEECEGPGFAVDWEHFFEEGSDE